MKNMFYSKENSSKLCSEEGAIKNLMNMLHFQQKIWTFLGIGHIKFVDPHGVIEWVKRAQGSFETKFKNWFDSEVPVDST